MGFINSLAVDKLLHVLFSFIICVIIAVVLSKCGVSHDPVIYLSLLCALLVGGLKEMADRFWNMGTASWNDYLADFIGITIAILFISIFVV